jgi:hypothetical protein
VLKQVVSITEILLSEDFSSRVAECTGLILD